MPLKDQEKWGYAASRSALYTDSLHLPKLIAPSLWRCNHEMGFHPRRSCSSRCTSHLGVLGMGVFRCPRLGIPCSPIFQASSRYKDGRTTYSGSWAFVGIYIETLQWYEGSYQQVLLSECAGRSRPSTYVSKCQGRAASHCRDTWDSTWGIWLIWGIWGSEI